MHTYASLKQQIIELGIRPDHKLLIHSSMKAVGDVQGGADTLLDVLCDHLADAGLLILPTHSWELWNCADNLFDPRTEKSCVGILGELFRQRPGVVRSWHPTHSVAALGREAAQFVEGEERTRSPAPRHGCWGRLYDIDADILFLGASLKKNTFLHGIEEQLDIPDRLASEPTRYLIRTPQGEMIEYLLHGNNSSCGDVSQNYDKVEPLFLQQGIAREGRIGSARSLLCSARGMADCVSALLQRDPHLFDNDLPLRAPA